MHLELPVVSFTLGDFVVGAAWTMFVSNVAHPIPQVDVHPLLCNAPPCSLRSQTSPSPLGSPVTNVRVDRLSFLLHGYEANFGFLAFLGVANGKCETLQD